MCLAVVLCGCIKSGGAPVQKGAQFAAPPSIGTLRSKAAELAKPGSPLYVATFRRLIGERSRYSNAQLRALTPRGIRLERITAFDRDASFVKSLDFALKLNAKSNLTAGLMYPFVLGGQKDLNNSYPDVVFVQLPGNEYCSGVVIKTGRVLTARHCVCAGTINFIAVGPLLGSMRVARVIGQRPSPAECQHSANAALDLGMLMTEDSVSPSGRLAKVATTAELDGAQAGTVVGYGIRVMGMADSGGSRNFGSVAIASVDCNGRGPNSDGVVMSDARRFGCVPNVDLVASATSGVDQCNGDSGGALLVADGTGAQVFGAVVSGPTLDSALPNQGGCGDGGIYVRLDTTAAQNWISDNSK